MSYLEIVTRALKGRSVNAAAKQWGVPQSTLDKYVKGQRLPDYMTAKKIADDAEIGYGEMLSTLAEEEEKRKELAELEKASYNASSLKQRGALAQLVEQRTLNP